MNGKIIVLIQTGDSEKAYFIKNISNDKSIINLFYLNFKSTKFIFVI
jgi:hypothetical protein